MNPEWKKQLTVPKLSKALCQREISCAEKVYRRCVASAAFSLMGRLDESGNKGFPKRRTGGSPTLAETSKETPPPPPPPLQAQKWRTTEYAGMGLARNDSCIAGRRQEDIQTVMTDELMRPYSKCQESRRRRMKYQAMTDLHLPWKGLHSNSSRPSAENAAPPRKVPLPADSNRNISLRRRTTAGGFHQTARNFANP